MPTKKITSTKKETVTKRSVELAASQTFLQKIRSIALRYYQAIKRRIQDLLARRPHRSFRRTRRRDYVRSLKMQGYWSFTFYVCKIIWQQKKLFFWFIILYGALTAILIGIGSQDTYTQLSTTLHNTSGNIFTGSFGAVGKASLLLASGVTGALNSSPTQSQQIESVILILFTWLTTVWLLRVVLAGRKPKLRDGIYNAGAPILSTFLVGLVMVIQLLPVAIAVLGFSAAISSGLLDGGVEAMVFWFFVALLVTLSLYWITSTLIALVVVTLPGMYPMQAIKTAGDLVIGRRVRVMLRIVWLLLVLAVIWLVIMVPIIMFDAWLKSVWSSIQWLPLVPVSLLVMSTLTVIWIASYVYLLYRKVVDDDTAPA